MTSKDIVLGQIGCLEIELEKHKEENITFKKVYIEFIIEQLKEVLKDLERLEKQDKILEILKKNTVYYSVDDNEYKIEINLTRDDDGFAEVVRWLNGK